MGPSTPSQRSWVAATFSAAMAGEEGAGAGLLDQAITRAAGAPLVGGNKVRLLRDAAEHYPAWLEAIRTAERTIFFESYIVHEDACGTEFADALAERAGAGVRVSGLWRLRFVGEEVSLTLEGSDPPTSITLRRLV